MDIDILIDSTVKILELLIEQYDNDKISFEDFKRHTSKKLLFLTDRINTTELSDRLSIETIIIECNKRLNTCPGCCYNTL